MEGEITTEQNIKQKRPLSSYKKEIAATVTLLGLFVAVGYFSQEYFSLLDETLGQYGAWGMVAYVFGATFATVVAPLSFLPALPIAVQLWGSFVAAVLSIIAWTIGAAIAFLLAKRFGRPLVTRLAGEEKMNYFATFLPRKYLFWAVVFMRLALPVDILSYVLGLFGVIRFRTYLLATVVGITPFAFAVSYLADLPVSFQIGALVALITLGVLSFPYVKRRYRQTFQDS